MEIDLNVEQQVPHGLLRGISFNILSEADAEKISVLAVEAANDLTNPKLGMPNLTYQCPTCGVKDLNTCEGHFGLIKFPFTILHPYFIPEIVRILNKVCPGCKSIRHERIKSADSKSKQHHPRNCRYCNGRLKDYYPTMKFRVSSKDMFDKTAIIVEVIEKLPRMLWNRSSAEVLASDYWDVIPKDAQQEESCLKPNKRVLTHGQVYHMLKDIDPRFLNEFILRGNPLFLNSFPVTPNCHRVTEIEQHLIFDKRIRAYRKLVDFRGTTNELSAHVLDCLKLSKLCLEKPSTTDSAPNTSSLKYVKEIVLGKRTGYCFRMVVIGDPNIRLGEIGIPCHIAENLQIAERLNSWNWEKLSTSCDLRILEKGEIYVQREGHLKRISFTDRLRKGDTIYRPLNDGDVVLINRPPSIHQHSLIALSVKVLPVNSVLSINPLICSPFRGDFDGDCFHGYVPQSIDSRIELHELVALNRQLINGQSGRNLLSLSHDSLTAAHLVMGDGVFLHLFQMQQLQMFCPGQLQLPTIFKSPLPNNYLQYTLSNTCLWTGKQLFSLLLPPDFDYIFPSNGVEIIKGELLSSFGGSSWLRDTAGNLFHDLVEHCQDKALDFLYLAQGVLCEWLSMRGLSVSLSDLYLSSDSYSRRHMIEEVSCGLREAEQISHIKLLMVDSNRDFLIDSEESKPAVVFGIERMCYEMQRSAALNQASISAFKRAFWDIQNLVYRYASRDNSLLAMLKAGSKGNLVKLVQHGMSLGLQHSLVPLSFRIPHRLSCAAWNNQKSHSSPKIVHDISARSYIPCAVVENSFLSGLNPLECFVHSLTTRDSSFSDNAALPGTLTRRLMFFMRDLYVGYDGMVRNAYGNHVVQFSYNITEPSLSSGTDGYFDKSTYACGATGGQPVGSLAACAISEAAYSALDQPVSVLETSPLLNLKKILECGVKKSSGPKTASLFLSKKLGRWAHGFEYGALAVQSHLERVLFSDIVSTVMIFFSLQNCGHTHISPWVCHFHICEEIAERRGLKVHSIIDALCINCNSLRTKSKINFPDLQITTKNCSVADTQKENNAAFCVTVTIIESSKNFHVQLDTLQDLVIPVLLATVVKGFLEFKMVEILWKDRPDVSKTRKGSVGELYLRVSMSENCDRTKFCSVLTNSCLHIMDMIDWERSHPDDTHDMSLVYGIDVAWNYFLTSLKSAISDTGKTTLPEHLCLAANCLSTTGEFVALNAKGLAQQRKHTSISSPFMQACFSNPGDRFIKAAKVGLTDDLLGSLDALAWGMIPSIGTGGQFDILYSGKGHEIVKPEDVYNLLGSHVSSFDRNLEVKLLNAHNHMSDKCCPQPLYAFGDFAPKEIKKREISATILRSFFSWNDIQRLSQTLKSVLHKYPINHRLNDVDKSLAMMALFFHPQREEKIGTGAQEIKVGYHSKYVSSRCFLLVRTDGTIEDFSYHKCVHRALEIIDPQRAKLYKPRWLKDVRPILSLD